MAFSCPITIADTHYVGDGQCVALVRSTCNMPSTFSTGKWRAGAPVRGNTALLPGTAIATFVHGVYPDHDRHAAVYLGQDAGGIRVKQQYTSGLRPWVVHEDYLPFGGKGSHKRMSDGNAYFVIEQ